MLDIWIVFRFPKLCLSLKQCITSSSHKTRILVFKAKSNLFLAMGLVAVALKLVYCIFGAFSYVNLFACKTYISNFLFRVILHAQQKELILDFCKKSKAFSSRKRASIYKVSLWIHRFYAHKYINTHDSLSPHYSYYYLFIVTIKMPGDFSQESLYSLVLHSCTNSDSWFSLQIQT